MDGGNKKRNIGAILLRLLSTLAVNAYICAGITVLRAGSYSDDGGGLAVLLYACTVCFSVVITNIFTVKAHYFIRSLTKTKFTKFLTFMLRIKNAERFLSLLAAWIMMIIPVAVYLMLYSKYAPSRSWFELLPAILAYAVPLKLSKLPPSRVVNDASLYIGLFILVICLEVPYLVNRLFYLRPWVFGAIFLLIFAYLIIKNQEGIDSNIFSKRYVEKSTLPTNLRRFNTAAVCAVFLLILLLLNLRSVIEYVIYLAGYVVAFIMKIYIWILENLLSDTELASGSFLQDESAYLTSPPTPYWNLISNIFRNFIIIYLFYRLLIFIASKVSAIAAKVVGWLSMLFGIKSQSSYYQGADYVDVTETVIPELSLAKKRIKKRGGRTRKNLKRILDPVEKVRYMYGLILDMMPLHGIKPDPSDTTSEILGKAAASEKIHESLSPFTVIYDQVRYGESIPGGETVRRAETYYRSMSDPVKDQVK